MKRRIALIILLVVFFTQHTLSQVTGVEKAEAMFLYNFARLIEWPAEYRTGAFVIGILGTTDVFDELQAYVVGKKVGFQDIEVKKFRSPDEIVKCHILFVSFSKNSTLPTVSNKVSNFSTLIVSEKEGAIELGAAINFLVVNNKLQFELKPDNAARYNLKISQRLKEMAVNLY